MAKKVLTLQQKLNLIAKTKREQKRIDDKKHKEEKKKEDEKLKQFKIYPPIIANMLKKAKRIDPWHGICTLNPYDVAIIVYYKLFQKGIDDIKLVNSSNHCWVEFKFSNKWYIFDVLAVKNTKYGQPIKDKYDPDNYDVYKELVRTYDSVEKFIEDYDEKITFTSEEAKIYAQKDDSLNTILNINYH